MTEFFRFLVETNLVTAAFVIGAIAFVIAIIGRFKTIIEPSPAMRFLLAVFGLFLMALSLGSYFISSQTKPSTADAPTQGPTSAPVVQPINSPTSPPSLPSPTIAPSAARPTETSISPSVAQPTPCPTREHKPISVGTGAFANAIYSDGLAECPEGVLKANHQNTQWVHPSVSTDGCGVSIYNTDKLWLAAFPGTVVTVNGNVIGEWTAPAYQHGYVIEYQIQIGDKICVNPPSSYTLLWGPDLFFEYDSYCFRGHCD